MAENQAQDKKSSFILWFDEVNNDDVGLVGGKNASLGEMYRELVSKGVNIPHGYCVTAHAYRYFLKQAGIKDKIAEILQGLDKSSTRDLEKCGDKIRSLIMSAQFPDDLSRAIVDAYSKLEKEYDMDVDVAVRSSATAEDLPDASFAGQQETFLNIHGNSSLLFACKRCMASLFTNRAISYRHDKGFDHFKVYLSIGIQKMVRSDLACSGVMFSLDTETGFKEVVLINASWGLGENIVGGQVTPDEFLVFKGTLTNGKAPIIGKKLGTKERKLIYSSGGTKPTKNIPTSIADRERFCLEEEEILTLSRWALLIESHYSQKNKHYTPMDIEWAKDGDTGKLFVVQARPETVHSQKDKSKLKRYVIEKNGAKVLVAGANIGSMIGSGKVRVIKDVMNIHEFKKGEVLVTGMTDPDWEPILTQAAAIVTDEGGRTCHAAIIGRELGIPCIVGTANATRILTTGQEVTVDCSGEGKGRVLDGLVRFKVEEVDLGTLPQLKTKICMNVGNPTTAFETSFIPNSGVGLARMEFVISNHIKCHPLALLHPEKLSKEVRQEVDSHTKGYANGREYFVEKLAQGVGTIAAAFYPKQVILRFSDFKTDEYANLVGGQDFEPVEANPMLGWRGASRYYDPKYREGFAMECEAVLKIRDKFGLTNLQVMIPFCRTVKEAHLVLKEMAQNGLKQHKNGLLVYGMCEIPSNVILADEFLDLLDGYSIGSNDLTQLVLGVDRNSEIISHLFDERNTAVKTFISKVIKVAHQKKKYIGICGQAPSDFPDFAEYLVREGIESISLNPDTVIKTTYALAKVEESLRKSIPAQK